MSNIERATTHETKIYKLKSMSHAQQLALISVLADETAEYM